VVLGTEALLRDHGVEAEAFAMQYPDNVKARYGRDFAPQISFEQGGLKARFHAISRVMGFGDVKDTFRRVLSDFAPDVVHLHNIHSYLSPVVGEIAHDAGCRVVWTLHDYKLICPNYHCLCGGKPCERCFTGGKHHVVTHRCMKNSLAASALAWAEAKKWNRARLERFTDAFVCPSEFMAKKMAQAGFAKEKLHAVTNFIDAEKTQRFRTLGDVPREDYYCYVGRLSPEKGVSTLLDVASRLPYTLKVAGTGPMEQELRRKYTSANIEFLGKLDGQQVAQLLAQAHFSVVPSEWYENNPLSVIESLCAGTPVVGANIGGIPELIDPSNGVSFNAGDGEALATAISMSVERQWNYEEIKAAATTRFAPETHLQRLLEIYGFSVS